MNRRGFLGSILALGAAPAIVRAENVMRLWVPREPTWIGMDFAREYYDGLQWMPVERAELMRRGPTTATAIQMQVNALIRRESDRYGQVYRQAFANALIYGESVMVSAHHSKIVTLR